MRSLRFATASKVAARLSPLISRAIVPAVILIQLFVVVMVLGRDDQRLEDSGR